MGSSTPRRVQVAAACICLGLGGASSVIVAWCCCSRDLWFHDDPNLADTTGWAWSDPSIRRFAVGWWEEHPAFGIDRRRVFEDRGKKLIDHGDFFDLQSDEDPPPLRFQRSGWMPFSSKLAAQDSDSMMYAEVILAGWPLRCTASTIALSDYSAREFDVLRAGGRTLPVGVVWLGLTGDTLFFGSLWMGCGVVARRLRHRLRRRRGQCDRCGYSRAGLATTAACPECGAAQA